MKKNFYLFLNPLLCLFFLLNLYVSHAQNLQWQKCYGGSLNEEGQVVVTTPDGGYILAGNSTTNDDGDVTGHHDLPGISDIWIVKVDSAGAIQWQKSLGGSEGDKCYDLEVTNDGGYILTGYTFF